MTHNVYSIATDWSDLCDLFYLVGAFPVAKIITPGDPMRKTDHFSNDFKWSKWLQSLTHFTNQNPTYKSAFCIFFIPDWLDIEFIVKIKLCQVEVCANLLSQAMVLSKQAYFATLYVTMKYTRTKSKLRF